jgi:hypothetical protein
VELGTVEIEYALSGEQQGVVWVDLTSGMSNSAIGQILSGQMTMTIEGQTVVIPVSIHGEVMVESNRVEP